MSLKTSPPQETLKAFALGELPESEIGEAAEHVECCSVLRTGAQPAGFGRRCDDGRSCGNPRAGDSGPQRGYRTVPDRSARCTESSRRDLGRLSGCGASSAGAGWGSCTRPPGSLGRHVALKILPQQATRPGSVARPGRPAGCTTPTSCRSSAWASMRAGTIIVMQYIAGRGLDAVLRERPGGRPA